MPAYDYRCSSCGYRFEQTLSYAEDHDAARCPHCGGVARRMFASPAIIFKGHGFYVTDHRASSQRKSSDHQGN